MSLGSLLMHHWTPVTLAWRSGSRLGGQPSCHVSADRKRPREREATF